MTTTDISVEAEIKQYTLVGDDIYVKRYTNENIPTWYSDMVSTIIAGDSTIADQSAAIAYLESLAPGYSISITNLQDKDLQIDTVLDSLVTTTGDHTAAIASLDITKVDSTSAAAISLDTIGAYFADGSAASYFNSYISTYASNIAANASSISTLSASLDNTTVRIDTVDEVLIEKSAVIRSTTAPTLITNPTLAVGDLWVNTSTADNITKVWNGTSWEDTSNTDTTQALTWSATSSKMITAPDGSITGWSFGDGSNVQSYFNVKATNFSISDGATGYVPFSITGSQIAFNGLVSFANTTGTPTHENGTVSPTLGVTTAVEGSTYYNTTTKEGFIVSSGSWIISSSVTDTTNLALTDMSNVTTIDGGKITTNTLQADRLKAGVSGSTVWTGGGLISANFNGNAYGDIGTPTTGFRLSSDAAGTSLDPNIYGAYTKGGTIEGTTMIASYIDFASAKVTAEGYPNNFGKFGFTYQSADVTWYGSLVADGTTFTTSTSPIIYGIGSGSGYYASRIVSYNSSILKAEVSGSLGIQAYFGSSLYANVYLQYRKNSGTWVTIKSILLYVSGDQTMTLPFSVSNIFDLGSLLDNDIIEFRGYITGSYPDDLGASLESRIGLSVELSN